MWRRALLTLPVVLAAAALGVGAGCQGDATGLYLSVITDLHAPAELDGIRLELSGGGQSYSSGEAPWKVGPGATYQLPGSFAVYGPDGQPVEVTLTGLLGDQPVVTRRARVA